MFNREKNIGLCILSIKHFKIFFYFNLINFLHAYLLQYIRTYIVHICNITYSFKYNNDYNND